MIETKVKAATGAAAVSGFVLWLLGAYVFDGEVPQPVVILISVAVPAAFAFGAGYLARHTHRPTSPNPTTGT